MANNQIITRPTNLMLYTSEVISRSGVELSKKLKSGEFHTDVHLPNTLRNSTGGLPVYGVIDKLSVAGSLRCRKQTNKLKSRLEDLCSTGRVSVRRRVLYAGAYKDVVVVRSKINSKRMFRLEYNPAWTNAADFRLEVSPQHFGDEVMSSALRWLERRLGTPFTQLLYEARVTRVDYAIDMWGWRIDDFWVSLSGARVAKVTCDAKGMARVARYTRRDDFNHDRVEEERLGYVCGSAKSDVEVSIYDKPMSLDELRMAIDLQLDQRQTVGEVNLSNRVDCTRVEIRFRPRRSSYLLRDIKTAPEIFSRIHVYPRYMVRAVLPSDLYNLIDNQTIFEMFAAMKGEAKEVRNRQNKISRLLRKCETNDFWDRNCLVAAWPRCVRQLGNLTDIKPLSAVKKKSLRRSDERLLRGHSNFYGNI